MKTLSFNAAEIFKAYRTEPLAGFPSWADVEFKPTPSAATTIGGCGLYCVSYEGRAIYVGKFLGSVRGPFTGSVLNIRWLRHLYSLSLRGRRFSISPGPLRMLLQDLEPGDLLDGLRAADPQVLTHDRGYLASYNRVRFASKKWATLHRDPTEFLERFDFGYVRLESLDTEGLSADLISAVVSNAEVRARQQQQLCCNGEVDFDVAWARAPVHLVDVLYGLKSNLIQELQNLDVLAQPAHLPAQVPNVLRMPRERRTLEADSAMESIEDDLPEGWPSDLLLRLRTNPPTPALEIHATATQPRGDVRVRVLDTRRVRNVFTMAWKPRLRSFRCRILLDPNQVEGQSGVSNVQQQADSLPTAFNFDADQETAQAIETLMNLVADAANSWRAH